MLLGSLLVLAIAYKGVSFPILYRMLDKRGSSHIDERIGIMDRYIVLFGKGTIKELLAGRVFIGERWFRYLNKNAIRYYIRILGNYQVMHAVNSKTIQVSRLFESLKVNKAKFLSRPYWVTGRICYLSALYFINEGKRDLMIVACFSKTRDSIKEYANRWQIESMFRAIKSSGFNLQRTHLSDINLYNIT